MDKVKILFGFDAPGFEKGVITALKQRGYEVESTAKYTKSSIRDFLTANPSYTTAVLLEVMNNSSDENMAKYTAEELALLTDERDMNIIVLLNESHKGTSFMDTLYAAGITSAIYQKGRKGGATPKEVAELIITKRNNRQAREYYGISDAPIKLGFLGNDTFLEYYNHLADFQYGNTLIERFINICTMMNPNQIADFVRRTPQEVLDELKSFEEFYMIVELIQGQGIDLKIKRSKKTRIGLSIPENMDLVRQQLVQNNRNLNSGVGNRQVDTSRFMQGADSIVKQKNKKEQEMSFEELLANIWNENDESESEDVHFWDDRENAADRFLGRQIQYKENAAGDLKDIHLSAEYVKADLKKTRKEKWMPEKEQALPAAEDFIRDKKKVHTGSYVAICFGVISTILIVIGAVLIAL